MEKAPISRRSGSSSSSLSKLSLNEDPRDGNVFLFVDGLSLDVSAFYGIEAGAFEGGLQRFHFEVETTRAVLADVEIVLDLVAAGEAKLRLIVEAVIAKEEAAAGGQSGEEVGDHGRVFIRVDGRQDENDGNDVDGRRGHVREEGKGLGQVANEGLVKELGKESMNG